MNWFGGEVAGSVIAYQRCVEPPLPRSTLTTRPRVPPYPTSGTVVIDGGSSLKASDKIFQINAASTFRVSNFTANGAGKFIRQNGGTTFKVSVFIDKCDISDMSESIFRTDSSSSTVSMTNTRYSDIGDAIFIGVSSGNITTSNNTEY